MRRQFSLYKEKTKFGTIWYARFWDESSQKYKHSRSTGILVAGKNQRRFEAEEVARELSKEFSEEKTVDTNISETTPTLTTTPTTQEKPTAFSKMRLALANRPRYGKPRRHLVVVRNFLSFLFSLVLLYSH